MKFVLLSFLMLSMFSGCTYSITMIHTEGTASDVVDETDTPSITAPIPLNGPSIPAVSIAPAPATLGK